MNCNKVNTQEINISNNQSVGSTKVDLLPNDAQFDNDVIVNKINELIGVLKNTGLLKQ